MYDIVIFIKIKWFISIFFVKQSQNNEPLDRQVCSWLCGSLLFVLSYMCSSFDRELLHNR